MARGIKVVDWLIPNNEELKLVDTDYVQHTFSNDTSKTQTEINEEFYSIIGDPSDPSSGTILERIDDLEEAVGDGGSVDERIDEAVENAAFLGADDGSKFTAEFDPQADTVHLTQQSLSNEQKTQAKVNLGVEEDINAAKEELNARIDLFTKDETIIVNTLPASGQPNKIYRRPNYPELGQYTDYGWNGSQFVLLATYPNDMDDYPTASSQNMVKSGGVKEAIDNVAFQSGEKVGELSIDDEPIINREDLVNSGGVFSFGEKIAETGSIIGNLMWLGQGYTIDISTGTIDYGVGVQRNLSYLVKISNASPLYSTNLSVKYYICYYDIDGNFISSLGWKYNIEYKFDDAPVNAIYFRILIDTEVCSTSDIKTGHITEELRQDKNNLSEIRTAAFGNQISILWKYNNEGLNISNGKYANATNRCATEKCSLSDISRISFIGNSAKYYVCYYDTDDVFISAKGWKTAKEFAFEDADINAVYFRIMIDTTVCLPEEIIPTIIDIKNDINNLKTTIFGENIEVDWREYGINVSNGKSATATNRNCTENQIKISDVDKIQFTSLSASYYICYYNTNGDFLSSFGWRTTLTYDFSEAPSNAVYFRILINTTVCSRNDVVIVPKNQGKIKDLETLEQLTKSFTNIITVSADGNGDYTTIEEALANAGDTSSTHVTIIVKPGIYYPAPLTPESNPYTNANRNISIIGLDRDSCILRGNTGYYYYQESVDYALLRLSGNVLIKNLTLINTCDNYESVATEEGWDLTSPHARAYCIHVDYGRSAGDIVRIENCYMYNDHFSCIGWGLRANSKLEINDCEFDCDVNAEREEKSGFNDYGTLYGHLSPTTIGENQKLEIKRCLIKNRYYNCGVKQMDGSGASDYSQISSTLRFVQNVLKTASTQSAFSNVTISGQSQVNAIDDMSYGNNVTTMNYQ